MAQYPLKCAVAKGTCTLSEPAMYAALNIRKHLYHWSKYTIHRVNSNHIFVRFCWLSSQWECLINYCTSLDVKVPVDLETFEQFYTCIQSIALTQPASM